MDKIASFTVNHLLLEPGVYVSRKDRLANGNAVVTTFDLRMTAPNREPVMGTAEVHAIEHLGATLLRNDPEWKDRVIYFGPMGCRTGFYLILEGDLEPRDIIGLLVRTFDAIASWEGEVPGAQPRDCGNWHDSDLNLAKWWARRYLEKTLRTIDDAHMTYPE
jgi:S-ribosylhomocysteine lyase